MASLTFGGFTFFDHSAGGVNYQFYPGSFSPGMIELKAPLGDGYFLKRTGRSLAVHGLELVYVNNSFTTVKSTLESYMVNTSLNSLVVPIFGTYENCRIASMGNWRVQRTDDSAGTYLISLSMDIVQYP